MRITIDIDGKEAGPATGAMTTTETAGTKALDAGVAADNMGITMAAIDSGGPPEWLLEAVGRAEAAEIETPAAGVDCKDAGPGPS